MVQDVLRCFPPHSFIWADSFVSWSSKHHGLLGDLVQRRGAEIISGTWSNGSKVIESLFAKSGVCLITAKKYPWCDLTFYGLFHRQFPAPFSLSLTPDKPACVQQKAISSLLKPFSTKSIFVPALVIKEKWLSKCWDHLKQTKITPELGAFPMSILSCVLCSVQHWGKHTWGLASPGATSRFHLSICMGDSP